MPLGARPPGVVLMNVDAHFKFEDLELVILPGKGPSAAQLELYNKVYECWRELWSSALKNEILQVDTDLYSNDFTKQDEVLALFYQGEFAGLSCLRSVDFNEDATKHDSYFSKWPEFTVRKLNSYGKRVLICSQLTVSPNFRRSYLGISWKDLLVALSARRLLDTDCDVMIGAVRRIRGMEKATYRSGFIPLMIDVPYIGKESADFVAYLKSEAISSEVKSISNIVDSLFPLSVVNTQFKGVKHAA